MPDFTKMSLKELLRPEGFDCACGRHHVARMKHIRLGKGALMALPEYLADLQVARPLCSAMKTPMRRRGRRWRTS